MYIVEEEKDKVIINQSEVTSSVDAFRTFGWITAKAKCSAKLITDLTVFCKSSNPRAYKSSVVSVLQLSAPLTNSLGIALENAPKDVSDMDPLLFGLQ